MERPVNPEDERPAARPPDGIRPVTSAEVPEADAVEQATEVLPGAATGPVALPAEVSEADALDQAAEVELDPDELRG